MKVIKMLGEKEIVMTTNNFEHEYNSGDNIMDVVRKSLNHNTNALFDFLKNLAFECAKSYKNANCYLVKNNDKNYSLGKSVLIVSELDRLKIELIETQEYWFNEIKEIVSPDGKEEELILANQIKQFNSLIAKWLKKMKVAKALFQRRIGHINHLMVENKIMNKVL